MTYCSTPTVKSALGINNLQVHKNRYSRSDVLLDTDCQNCPGYAGQRTTLVLCVQEIREDKTKHAEKYRTASWALPVCKPDVVPRGQRYETNGTVSFQILRNSSQIICTGNHSRKCVLCESKYSLDKIRTIWTTSASQTSLTHVNKWRMDRDGRVRGMLLIHIWNVA